MNECPAELISINIWYFGSTWARLSEITLNGDQREAYPTRNPAQCRHFKGETKITGIFVHGVGDFQMKLKLKFPAKWSRRTEQTRGFINYLTWLVWGIYYCGELWSWAQVIGEKKMRFLRYSSPAPKSHRPLNSTYVLEARRKKNKAT